MLSPHDKPMTDDKPMTFETPSPTSPADTPTEPYTLCVKDRVNIDDAMTALATSPTIIGENDELASITEVPTKCVEQDTEILPTAKVCHDKGLLHTVPTPKDVHAAHKEEEKTQTCEKPGVKGPSSWKSFKKEDVTRACKDTVVEASGSRKSHKEEDNTQTCKKPVVEALGSKKPKGELEKKKLNLVPRLPAPSPTIRPLPLEGTLQPIPVGQPEFPIPTELDETKDKDVKKEHDAGSQDGNDGDEDAVAKKLARLQEIRRKRNRREAKRKARKRANKQQEQHMAVKQEQETNSEEDVAWLTTNVSPCRLLTAHREKSVENLGRRTL